MTIYSLVFPVLSLSLCLSSLSIQVVANQRIAYNYKARQTPTKVIIKSCLRINIISSSIIAIIILLSFPLYKFMYGSMDLYYPLLCCIPLIYCSNLAGIIKGYLEANKLFHITSLSNLLEQTAKILVTFLVIYIFREKSILFKVSASYLAMSVSEIISFSYLIFRVRKITSFTLKENKTDFYEKEILKQAMPLTMQSLVLSLAGFFEPIIFTYACSKINISTEASSTYYAMICSYAIPLLIMAIFSSFSVAKAIFPFLSEYKDDKKRSEWYINKALYFCFIFALLNFNISYFYPDFVLNLFYNDASSAPIVSFLAPFYFFSYFTPIFVVVMQAHQLEKQLLMHSIVSSAVGLICIFVLCQNPLFNTSGLAITVVISGLLNIALHYISVRKHTGYKIKIKAIILSIALILQNIIQTLLLSNTHFILNFILTNATSLIFLWIFYNYRFGGQKVSHHLLQRKKRL